MGKKRPKKKERRKAKQKQKNISPGTISWQDGEGLHFVTPGLAPTPEQIAEMTKEYQNRIRNSPLWDEMVKQFGLEKAEELLKQCQVQIKPGPIAGDKSP